ncbi:MAG: AAA family ATPase, partial [Acidimicrobiia bacterium]
GQTEELIQALCRRYLAGRRPLFADRVSGGKVRDGHGDLLADDVFLLPDGPRVLDCLEFDDQLRYGDVLADLAFLVMDLERVGAPDLGIALLDHYSRLSGERFPATLTHHYIAMRAHIRAKVACLRESQGDPEAADEARRLHEMTRAHLQQGRVALVLVGGAPGTGKSTVAAGIGTQMGWKVIRSDEIRKDLAHVEPTTQLTAEFGEGAYDDASTAATYREMLERARNHLEFGECVVLDATWHDAAWRRAAAELRATTHSDLIELRCDAPVALTERRIRERNHGGQDASDATPAIAAQVEQTTDPWPSATRVDTASDPGTALEIALGAIGHRG